MKIVNHRKKLRRMIKIGKKRGEWLVKLCLAKQGQKPIEYQDPDAHLIDLSRVDLIRGKDLTYLSNASLLEQDLLPQLGLNNECLFLFPKELWPFCRKGLFIWQYPNQFSQFLVQLSKFRISSYMEIGVRHGGTFVTVVEYLSKFNPIRNAVAVDINDCSSLIKYTEMNPIASFMKADSTSSEFEEFVNSHPGFDLVMIDGDHSEASCRSDYELVKDKANMISFHDIEANAAPGVAKVWSKLKAMHQGEHLFFEYREQYGSVRGKWMGIGLAVKINMLNLSG